jgi:hypothetical protein
VTPYAPTIKEGAEKLRESREKARLESTGGQVMFPQEKGIHLQKEVRKARHPCILDSEGHDSAGYYSVESPHVIT